LYDVAPYGEITGSLEVASIATINSVHYGTADDINDSSHTLSILIGFREYVVRPRDMSNTDFITAWCAAVASGGGGTPPTVNGITESNTALEDLLSKLEALGIIVDGTIPEPLDPI